MKNSTIYASLFCWVIACFSNNSEAQDVLQERIYVQTAKEKYHAGETILLAMHVIDANTRKPVSLSRVAYVELLDSANKAALQTVVALKDGSGEASIELPDLLPGVYVLVAYTNWMKNFGAQWFYYKEIAITNGHESAVSFVSAVSGNEQFPAGKLNIQLRTSKTQYSTREKGTLTLSDLPPNATTSVSIYRLHSNEPSGLLTIVKYIDTLSKASSPTEFPYVPECNGMIVRGRVFEAETRMPARGIDVFLTIVGKGSGFYNSVSDRDGFVMWEVRDLSGSDSLIVQAEKDGTLYKVEIESPFWEHVYVSHRGRFGKIDEGNGEMINSYVDAQVQQVFARSVSNHSQTAPDVPAAFFGKPDDHYNLDDYTRFSKMEEVFREYVAPVAVNRIGGRPVLRVYKPDEHETYNRDPIVLVDGYPIMDIAKLFEFDPLKVRTIDVVNRRYARTGAVFDGIVNLTTYSGNLNGYKVDSAATIVRNMNIAEAKKFVAPVYEDSTQQYSRLPDFRNQLYWNANVDTSEITFFTSDLEGTFIAVVQAVNENGELGSNEIRFEVKKGER